MCPSLRINRVSEAIQRAKLNLLENDTKQKLSLLVVQQKSSLLANNGTTVQIICNKRCCLIVQERTTFHAKRISLHIPPCQEAFDFSQANFTSLSLPRGVRLSTRSEFYHISSSIKKIRIFYAKRVLSPFCQGTSNFPREASSLHLPLSQRAHDFLREVSFTPLSSCFKARDFLHEARSNSFFPSAEGRMKGQIFLEVKINLKVMQK